MIVPRVRATLVRASLFLTPHVTLHHLGSGDCGVRGRYFQGRREQSWKEQVVQVGGLRRSWLAGRPGVYGGLKGKACMVRHSSALRVRLEFRL